MLLILDMLSVFSLLPHDDDQLKNFLSNTSLQALMLYDRNLKDSQKLFHHENSEQNLILVKTWFLETATLTVLHAISEPSSSKDMVMESLSNDRI